jgi:glucose-6-phosphate 1-dehydrogenase
MAFLSGDLKDETLPERLADAIKGRRVIVYLALPAASYPAAFRAVHAVYERMGLPQEEWRVLVEKPFGRSSAEAAALNDVIDATLGEAAIYRVDHYIQKESVQNMLAYRFSNELFGMIGNPKILSSLSVTLLETDTIDGRGAFYDATGALNDVVQNHVLQMLAAATMPAPQLFSADAMRAARTDLFSRLRLADSGHLRARYEGYPSTAGVAADSTTETYVRLMAFIDHPDWNDVPIILEAGKGLSEKTGGVRFSLQQSKGRICFDETCDHENTFEFLVAPEEKAALTVWGKKPGLHNELMPQHLSFSFSGPSGVVDRAYDRVLYDAWKNDASRFVVREEAAASWKFIDAARAALKATPLITYPVGTHPDVVS